MENNHRVIVNFDRITQYDSYYSSGQDDNRSQLQQIGKDFFDLSQPFVNSRHEWKNKLLDKLYYTKYFTSLNLKPRFESRLQYFRLFESNFADGLHDLILPLFKQRYEYDGSIMKGTFETDPTFVERVKINNPNAKIHMIGDIHGSLHAFYYTLSLANDMFLDDTWTLKENVYLIFLGDIVDYSFLSLECLALAFLIYIANPTKVTIINGNHEDKDIYMMYHFSAEMDGQILSSRLKWEKLLHYLPSAVYLDFMGKIYHLSHGVFDENYCMTYTDEPSKLHNFLQSGNQFDMVNPETSNLDLNQYKWGDMYQSLTDTSVNKSNPDRYGFSPAVIDNYLKIHNIECIISGHQDNIPFGFVTKNSVDTSKFAIEANIIRNGYDLYVPSNPEYNNRQSDTIIDSIELKPNEDFIGLVTSNATQAKPLVRSCYLVLLNKTVHTNDNNNQAEPIAQDNAVTQPPVDNTVTQPSVDNTVTQPPVDEAVADEEKARMKQIFADISAEWDDDDDEDDAVTQPPVDNTVTQPPVDKAVTQPPVDKAVTQPPVDNAVVQSVVDNVSTQIISDHPLPPSTNQPIQTVSHSPNSQPKPKVNVALTQQLKKILNIPPLPANNSSSNMHGGDIDYERLYMKYKAKYLKLLNEIKKK